MTWTALGTPINDGINLFWRLPETNEPGTFWIRVPGFTGGNGNCFVGIGDERPNAQPDQVQSRVDSMRPFGRIYRFDVPPLTSPVLGLRFEGGELKENPTYQLISAGAGTSIVTLSSAAPISYGPIEPAQRPLWWETSAQGVPIYNFAWRWSQVVQRWVSDRAFLVSFAGYGSGFKSGGSVSQFRLQPGSCFVERLDYRFYLNTGVSAVNWSVELKEIGAGLADPTWQTISLTEAPLQQWRFASVPINELRNAPLGGWSWKLIPVQSGGSVNFDVQMLVREVRPL